MSEKVLAYVLLAVFASTSSSHAAPIIVSPSQQGHIYVPQKQININVSGSGSGSGSSTQKSSLADCYIEISKPVISFPVRSESRLYYTLIGAGGGTGDGAGTAIKSGGGGGGSTALIINGAPVEDRLTGALSVARGGDGGEPGEDNDGKPGEIVRGEALVRVGDLISIYIGGGGGGARAPGAGGGGAGYFGGGGGSSIEKNSAFMNGYGGRGGGVSEGGAGGMTGVAGGYGGFGFGGDGATSASTRVPGKGGNQLIGGISDGYGGGGGAYGGGGSTSHTRNGAGDEGLDGYSPDLRYGGKGLISKSRGKGGEINTAQSSGAQNSGGDAGAAIISYQSAVCWINE